MAVNTSGSHIATGGRDKTVRMYHKWGDRPRESIWASREAGSRDRVFSRSASTLRGSKPEEPRFSTMEERADEGGDVSYSCAWSIQTADFVYSVELDRSSSVCFASSCSQLRWVSGGGRVSGWVSGRMDGCVVWWGVELGRREASSAF